MKYAVKILVVKRGYEKDLAERFLARRKYGNGSKTKLIYQI